MNDDNSVMGIVMGFIFGGVFWGFLMTNIQYSTTLREIAPFVVLQCDTSYIDMSENQKKFCEYYKGGKND